MLSNESYTAFNKALLEYKNTKNYEVMVATIADLFTSDPSSYHLFQSEFVLAAVIAGKLLCNHWVVNSCINV